MLYHRRRVSVLISVLIVVGCVTIWLIVFERGQRVAHYPDLHVRSSHDGFAVRLHPQQRLVLDFKNMNQWGRPEISGSLKQLSARVFQFESPFQGGFLIIPASCPGVPFGTCGFMLGFDRWPLTSPGTGSLTLPLITAQKSPCIDNPQSASCNNALKLPR